MRLSDLHRRVLAQEEFKFLLDDFPNAAAAYSLRKLRSAYTGNCIEVRRSSDNALQNIGFVNNVLDTASLLSFVGAGDGFVRTWYDQSGNINVTETDNARQPKIVSSGVLETQNGKPTIVFDGVNDTLSAGTSNLFRNVGFGHIFDVHSIKTSYGSVNRAIYAMSDASSVGTTRMGSGGGVVLNKPYLFARRLDGGSGQTLSSTIDQQTNVNYLFSRMINWSNATAFLYENSVLVNSSLSYLTAGNTSNTNSLRFFIGAGLSGAWKDVNFAELVIYQTDQNANRTGIEQNINRFYKIF